MSDAEATMRAILREVLLLRGEVADLRRLAEQIRDGKAIPFTTPAVDPYGPPPESKPVLSFDEVMAGLAVDREDRSGSSAEPAIDPER
jgi:hypothetical protein